MRNDCSVSGDWCLEALEHEYIDSGVMPVVVGSIGCYESIQLEVDAGSFCYCSGWNTWSIA